MEMLGVVLDNGSLLADSNSANPQEASKLLIQYWSQSLIHVCQCEDADCRLPSSCLKLKRVLLHTKICKKRSNGYCHICKDSLVLCYFHAKYCEETKCSVLFCLNIKDQLNEEKIKQLQYGKESDQEARKLSTQRCIQSLVHACQCRDANCHLISCQIKKRIVQHTKICKRKAYGNCLICKRFITLCCYHAKNCQETNCLVPICSKFKDRMERLQSQERMLDEKLFHRIMAMTNIEQGSGLPGYFASTSQTVSPGDDTQVPLGVNTPALSNPGLPCAPGIRMKPGTETPLAKSSNGPKKKGRKRLTAKKKRKNNLSRSC